PPDAKARARTKPNAVSAPTNAHVVSPTAPAPTPSTTTRTAPVEAPEEMPRMYGSASGLRSSDCRMTPHNASPAPAWAAMRVRGSRRFQMIPSWIRVSPESEPVRRARADWTTSVAVSPDGPMVMTSAVDTASSPRPPSHRVTSADGRRRGGRRRSGAGTTGAVVLSGARGIGSVGRVRRAGRAGFGETRLGEAQLGESRRDGLHPVDRAQRRVHLGAGDVDESLPADRRHLPGDGVGLEVGDLGLRGLGGLALAGQVAHDDHVR